MSDAGSGGRRSPRIAEEEGFDGEEESSEYSLCGSGRRFEEDSEGPLFTPRERLPVHLHHDEPDDSPGPVGVRVPEPAGAVGRFRPTGMGVASSLSHAASDSGSPVSMAARGRPRSMRETLDSPPRRSRWCWCCYFVCCPRLLDEESDEDSDEEEPVEDEEDMATKFSLNNRRKDGKLTDMEKDVLQMKTEEKHGIFRHNINDESWKVGLLRRFSLLDFYVRMKVKEALLKHEPARYPALDDMLNSTKFDLLITFLIIANSVTIGAETFYSVDEPKPSWLEIIEHVFIACFVVEIACQILVRQWPWIFNAWNFFDLFIIVVAAVIPNWILKLLGYDLKGVGFVSALRVMRLLRLFNKVRTIPFFSELWMIGEGVKRSMYLIFWSLVMIATVLFVFAVAFVETVARSETFASDPDVQTWFGSMHKAMITLFQIMTMDAWGRIFRHVAQDLPEATLLILIFVVIAGLVLTSLLLAIVLRNTFEMVEYDEKAQAKLDERKRVTGRMELAAIFNEMDEDSSGLLDKNEFLDVMSNVLFIRKMKTLDIDIDELPDIFDIIDDSGDGAISIGEFIDGVTNLQGTAVSWDVMKASASFLEVNKKGRSLLRTMLDEETEVGNVSGTLDRIDGDLDATSDSLLKLQIMCTAVMEQLNAQGARKLHKCAVPKLPTVDKPTYEELEALEQRREEAGKLPNQGTGEAKPWKPGNPNKLKPVPWTFALQHAEQEKKKQMEKLERRRAMMKRLKPKPAPVAEPMRVPGVVKDFGDSWCHLNVDVSFDSWRPALKDVAAVNKAKTFARVPDAYMAKIDATSYAQTMHAAHAQGGWAVGLLPDVMRPGSQQSLRSAGNANNDTGSVLEEEVGMVMFEGMEEMLRDQQNRKKSALLLDTSVSEAPMLPHAVPSDGADSGSTESVEEDVV